MAKTKTALGIEAVGNELRLALVESGEHGVTLLHHRTVSAGEDLNRVFRSLPRRPASVVCSVSLEHGAIRILNLPPTTDENLDRVVAMEAEMALPLDAEELALASHVLGMTEQSRLEVMVAAARQTAVQEVQQRANSVSWVNATSTLSSIALINALQQIQGDEREPVCAILRIEAQSSELIVLDRQRVLTAQMIPLGCGANVPVASGAAVSGESGSEGGVATLEQDEAPWIATLSQQIRYALRAASYERALSIGRLYVCGEGASHPTLTWQLSDRLDLPISVLSPAGIAGDKGARYAVAYGSALQAAGAATMPLSLSLARLVGAREAEQRRQIRVSWVALAASVVVSGGLLFGAMVRNQQILLEQARAELRQVQEIQVASTVDPDELEKMVSAVKEGAGARVPVSTMLRLLSRNLPQEVWLTELTYRGEAGAVVRGFSLEPNGPQRSQIALLRQQVFDEVTLDYRTEDRIANVPVWGFQLSCKLIPASATTNRRGRQSNQGGAQRSRGTRQ